MLEQSIALGISLRVCIDIVLPAVNLDDEAMAQTDKVDNIAVSGGLTTKVITSPPPRTQMNP